MCAASFSIVACLCFCQASDAVCDVHSMPGTMFACLEEGCRCASVCLYLYKYTYIYFLCLPAWCWCSLLALDNKMKMVIGDNQCDWLELMVAIRESASATSLWTGLWYSIQVLPSGSSCRRSWRRKFSHSWQSWFIWSLFDCQNLFSLSCNQA